MRPYISIKLCDNCRECVSLCPYDVFADPGGDVTVSAPEDCIECLTCVEICPKKAIRIDD